MDISFVTVDEIKTNPTALKQLKRLTRAATGEQLKIFSGDLIIMAKHNSKIIGMCNIAMRSPESHFTNEIGREIPYLYNYICDFSQRKRKPSVHIMNFVKTFLIEKKYENDINLDVLVENTHAQNFFEKNNFIKSGTYEQSYKEYVMYTFSGSKNEPAI
jgi:hypothetical protein